VTDAGLARRQQLRLFADPSRVVARLFVPGHAFPGGGGRASEVVAQLRSLDDEAVGRALESVNEAFDGRHRDLVATMRHNAERLRNRLPREAVLDDERWLLLGATFTQELAIEAAALCNPSMVADAGRAGLADGETGFVMSVRQIGEGHRSSIGFRTGIVDAAGNVSIDALTPFATTGTQGDIPLSAHLFTGGETLAWVLAHLGASFTRGELDAVLADLSSQRDTRKDTASVIQQMRTIADRTYATTFPAASELHERVLYPVTRFECNGVEDARFVRVTHEHGGSDWRATYTAFDGSAISQHSKTCWTPTVRRSPRSSSNRSSGRSRRRPGSSSCSAISRDATACC
jgi:hypothetical protein